MQRVCYKKIIALVGFFWGSSFLGAKQLFYEHTFVPSRTIEHSRVLLWSKYFQQVDAISKKRIGTKVQRASYYYTTLKNKNVANYLGMYNQLRGEVEPFIGVDQDNPAELLSSQDIIHDYTHASAWPTNYGLRDHVHLQPEERVFGFKLDIVQSFDSWNDRIHLRVSIPVLSSKTHLHPTSQADIARSMDLPGGTDRITLLDYLAGEVANDSSGNVQESLKKLKISRKSLEKKGISDIEIAARYRLVETQLSHIDFGAKLMLPVGKKTTAEFLFEPRIGNGGHMGSGLEGLLSAVLWSNDTSCVELLLHVDYWYLWQSDEIRAPLFKNASDEVVPWGMYQIGSEIGTKRMFPMANVLARPFKVSPGHRAEIVATLTYQNQGFLLEGGGVIWGRGKEGVEIIDWSEDLYGLTRWSYNTNNLFTISQAFSSFADGQNAPEGLRLIAQDSLHLDSITTPPMIAAQVYLAMGYTYEKFRYPISFSGGVMREFGHSTNAMTDAWMAWVKLGVSF